MEQDNSSVEEFDEGDSHRYEGHWATSCPGRLSCKPSPSRRQRHRGYKPWQRAGREAAGAAERSRSPKLPVSRFSTSQHPLQPVIEVKEDHPVAARALKLTLR